MIHIKKIKKNTVLISQNSMIDKRFKKNMWNLILKSYPFNILNKSNLLYKFSLKKKINYLKNNINTFKYTKINKKLIYVYFYIFLKKNNLKINNFYNFLLPNSYSLKKKNYKNITFFFNKIFFFNYLFFLNFYTKISKKFYFLNLYTQFLLKRFYFYNIFNQVTGVIDNGVYHIYSKFKIFNFFKLLRVKKYLSHRSTYINLLFFPRNFFISFYNYYYRKFWSIGLFLKYLKLKYKVKNQIRYIKTFLFFIKLQFTKHLNLFLNKISKRFSLFLNNLINFLNNFNRKVYKSNFIRLNSIIIRLKFKTFEKTFKKKPRRKKYIIKKLKKYKF